MVLFAQILLYMIALWIFWRILPVTFCQIYYLFTQTAKFNQIKFDLRTILFDVLRFFTAAKIWKYWWKMPFFCSEYFFMSRSVYIFFLKNKIRNVTIPNFSVRYKEKGAQNWTPHLSKKILCKYITSVTILLTPYSESSSIAPDALHNIYVCIDFVKNISKKLRFPLPLYKSIQ